MGGILENSCWHGREPAYMELRGFRLVGPSGGHYSDRRKKRHLEDGTLEGKVSEEFASRKKEEKERDRARPTTAFGVLLYSPPSSPAFKFWTHETTYPLEHLREPTVSPQTEWGQGDGHGEANREAMEGHGWSRRFGSVKFAFMGKKTWQRPWHRQDVPYNIQFVVWQR